MIVPLHAANPGPWTGAGNWTYFLPGRHPVLIDAGTGQAAHLEALAAERAAGPGRVLVTHAHSDHIAGAAAIAARWPETRFAKHPLPDRDAKYAVRWTSIGDGDVVDAGDGELQAILTPGHAPDHLAFWHAASRTLFCGDLVVAGSTVVIPATSGGSLTQYLASLERIRALAPARLLPAHGDPIEDPDAAIQRYLEHRHMREREVLAALAAGRRTVDGIVETIYVGLPASRVSMACESVLAHLRKLEDEGRVRREGQEWVAGDP